MATTVCTSHEAHPVLIARGRLSRLRPGYDPALDLLKDRAVRDRGQPRRTRLNSFHEHARVTLDDVLDHLAAHQNLCNGCTDQGGVDFEEALCKANQHL